MCLADRAITMRLIPNHHTFFAELMATDGQDANFKRHLTNDTHARLIGLGSGLFQVQHYM